MPDESTLHRAYAHARKRYSRQLAVDEPGFAAIVQQAGADLEKLALGPGEAEWTLVDRAMRAAWDALPLEERKRLYYPRRDRGGGA